MTRPRPFPQKNREERPAKVAYKQTEPRAFGGGVSFVVRFSTAPGRGEPIRLLKGFHSSMRTTHTRSLAGRAARALCLFAATGLVAAVTPAISQAQTIQAADRGWYDQTGFHDTGNQNIFTGSEINVNRRNWFVFNVPTGTYSAATLRFVLSNTDFVQAGRYESIDATETYNLVDVTTSVASLTGGTGGVAAYNDLGSGTAYGTRVFSSADNNTTVDIFLSSNALAAINASAGGQFALGGFLSTATGGTTQAVFSFSDFASTNGSALVLTAGISAAPEPGSVALVVCGGVGMMGIIARRKRRTA